MNTLLVGEIDYDYLQIWLMEERNLLIRECVNIAGLKYGEFKGEDRFTTVESEKLLRLPMYYGLKEADIEYICESIKEFYEV